MGTEADTGEETETISDAVAAIPPAAAVAVEAARAGGGGVAAGADGMVFSAAEEPETGEVVRFCSRVRGLSGE